MARRLDDTMPDHTACQNWSDLVQMADLIASTMIQFVHAITIKKVATIENFPDFPILAWQTDH